MHHSTDRITHITAFVTQVVEHWLEREIAQWVHPMKDRSDDPPHGKTSEFSPLMNVLKRGFFDGAYIEKWGMVFWGESNKEEKKFKFFFYYGRNIPFIYYLLTYLLFLPCILTHFIIFITDNELTLCRFEPKRTVWFGLCVVTDCLTN